jgi:nitronate monooxygenase
VRIGGELVVGEKRAKYPIIQGQMAIGVSLEPLAGAVAALGGIGLIAGSGQISKLIPADNLIQRIREGRKLAGGGILGIGIMYAASQFDDILTVCIQEKVDLVVIGAGFARDPFVRLATAGIPAWAIISSEKLAALVTRIPSITGVVVESGQAGGHLGPKDPDISTWDLFPPVYRTLRDGGFRGPVIAAGGIRHGWEVARIMEMGADGVQIGQLFAMTEECSASPQMKKLWVEATSSKVTYVSPVGMPSRAVERQSLDSLPKLPPSGKGCIDCLKFCAHRVDHAQKHCIYRSLTSSIEGRLRLAADGAIENGLVFTGGRVGEINDIVPVQKRMEALLAEMKEGPRASLT